MHNDMKKILFLVSLMATMVMAAGAQEVKGERTAPVKHEKVAPQRLARIEAASQKQAKLEEATKKHSVPAYRGMIERTQPNGYVLRTFLRGDEHKHWSMTEDGWQILENKKGWLKYAKLNRKGELKISWRKAHNAEDRSKCEKRWLEKHGVQKHV